MQRGELRAADHIVGAMFDTRVPGHGAGWLLWLGSGRRWGFSRRGVLMPAGGDFAFADAKQLGRVIDLAGNIRGDEFIASQGGGPQAMVAVGHWPAGAGVAQAWNPHIELDGVMPSASREVAHAADVVCSQGIGTNRLGNLGSIGQHGRQLIRAGCRAGPGPAGTRVAQGQNAMKGDDGGHWG